ncbi:GGDEF and EAL domain-containing protein [Roseibium marinum]|uniref:Diguanylate cyclase (GGDEF)-like protein n=1 Tax=Roseibium marinum TaxID=281252 RepID=A0A2S3V1W8_9HYPH|nr:GGDEF and EAL domain-containing protein [Roseibium marinum]POF33956.1 diguanylate cyclase (GGDEF)-like protein [Roseibium marinum]
MQVSQRFIGDRREGSGHPEFHTPAGFHASLLEVLPHAAAYVAQDGSILARNGRLKAVCAALGVDDVPARLSDLLSADSWKRCETVLAAAFNGVPSEASGRMSVKSGAAFCRNVICTSFLSLSRDRRAVLVQFDMSEAHQEEPQDGPREGQPERAREMPGEAPMGLSGTRTVSGSAALNKCLLDHFPDDVVVFNGSESIAERSALLLDVLGGDYEAGFLAAALEELKGHPPQTLYIPQTPSFEPTAYENDRKMCEIRLVPLPGQDDGDSGAGKTMAIIRRNVDCPHEAAENRRLAYLDPLTGLENRRAFTKALKRELKRLASEAETGLAVFYIDLDEFKKVNDLGGHDVGDDMLLRVAACLTLTLGESGTAARIGGDEFAGMLPVADKEVALQVAEEILEGFDRIRLEVHERIFTIGGSIGVAFVDGGRPLREVDASVLLGLADRACLRGKRFGGQSVQIHNVHSADDQVCAAELTALPEPGSFRASELTLYAMPIMHLKKGRIFGSEVLLRLQGERAGELSSRAWIAAAERSGFIAQVDAWTLDKVLNAADRHPARMTLTMNVSADSARDPGFREGFHQRLSANPLLASKLCLEISEKDFLREPSTVESFFRYVTDLGCQTAIDDFAGHWPVLSRLTGLRVVWLKLESGLTRQVTASPAKAAILAGLVRAAHELGIKVAAKHVETAEEADLLRTLDIEAAQGYFFGKPVPWPEG